MTGRLLANLPSIGGKPCGSPHDRRVVFLRSLAVLTGNTIQLARLPDGSVPDVLQRSASGLSLFLGEAKDTEDPGRLDTQYRLLGYLSWLRSGLVVGTRAGTAAVCYGSRAHTPGWTKVLATLARDAGLWEADGGHSHFETGLNLVWLRWESSCTRGIPGP